MHNYQLIRSEDEKGTTLHVFVHTIHNGALSFFIQSLRTSLLLWCVVAGIQYLRYCVWSTQIRSNSSN